MTKTPAEAAALLTSLGLNPKGDSLVPHTVPAKVVQPVHVTTSRTPHIAPTGVDPRLMPVDDIEFDPALLDGFPSLEGDGYSAACNHLHSIYKSYQKGDRNKVLWRKIGQFVTHTRRSRETGGMVKEAVKATKADRDIAAVVASEGLSVADLAEAIRLLHAARTTD